MYAKSFHVHHFNFVFEILFWYNQFADDKQRKNI